MLCFIRHSIYANNVFKFYKKIVVNKSTLTNVSKEKNFAYYKILAKNLGIEKDEIIQTTAFEFARMDINMEKELEKKGMQINMEKEILMYEVKLAGQKAYYLKSISMLTQRF